MTPRPYDILLTALAPAVWGSTYVVTTELLPDGYPLTSAMLRALPAGLLLLLFVRALPPRVWLMRIIILGALNFSIFWALLFVAAYRLPGGVAATVGALQPLMVIFIASVTINSPIYLRSVVAATAGVAGVALLVLSEDAALEPIGLIAALGGAVSMAIGIVLSRKWRPNVPTLTFAAWQLAAGGALLLPVSILAEPPLPAPTTENMIGFTYLGLIGGAATYALWFRGVGRMAPTAVSALGFLSPASALILGWVLLDQRLSGAQIAGFLIVLASIWLSQVAVRPMRRTLSST